MIFLTEQFCAFWNFQRDVHITDTYYFFFLLISVLFVGFQFNLDMDLYLVKPDMTYAKVVLRDLLPMAFTPKSLEEERI